MTKITAEDLEEALVEGCADGPGDILRADDIGLSEVRILGLYNLDKAAEVLNLRDLESQISAGVDACEDWAETVGPGVDVLVVSRSSWESLVRRILEGPSGDVAPPMGRAGA